MDRSVRQSVDPVRRGVHGPGVSIFGSPVKFDVRDQKYGWMNVRATRMR